MTLFSVLLIASGACDDLGAFQKHPVLELRLYPLDEADLGVLKM